MERDEHQVFKACLVSGSLFAAFSLASFSILWAVNWRPWRLYRRNSFSNVGSQFRVHLQHSSAMHFVKSSYMYHSLII
ncbi:hypothetical protein RJ641_007486 [Dillenia turbinata]|uniref:Uncharacterized protein n=1 Tax=Dillenia turbinata TaxID=194707 RepID=A0AAN8VE09_9MAGN